MFLRDLGPIEAYIYNRKSREEKDRQILSLGDQSDYNRESARRFSAKVLREFEEAKSAKAHGQRPLFAELLDLIRRSKSPVWIICWKLDRLSRNPMDSALVTSLMEEGRIEGIITSQRVFHRSENVMMLAIEFASANQYIRDLSTNVKRGMRSKAEKGGWNHLAPIGYVNRGGKVEIDRPLIPYFRELFRMRREGFSYREIADALHSLGLRGKQGGKVLKAAIQKVILNPFYAGYTLHEGKLIKANHTPMITYDEFTRNQPERGKTSHRGATFPWSRALRCACGHMLSGYEAKRNVYYKCSFCRFNVSQGIIEGLIGKEVARFAMTPSEAAQAMREVGGVFEARKKDDELPNTIEGQVTLLKRRLARLQEMRENGEIDSVRFMERNRVLSGELASLEERLAERRSQPKKTSDRLSILELLIFVYQYYLSSPPDLKSRLARIISSNWVVTKESALPDSLSDDFSAILDWKVQGGRPPDTQLEPKMRLFASLFSGACSLDRIGALPGYPNVTPQR